MKEINIMWGFIEIMSPVKLFLARLYWKFLGQKEFKFEMKFLNKKFYIYSDSFMDFVAIRETFIEKEYLFKYSQNPKIILDLGANVGDTAFFYSILFPEATIYAVEPNNLVYKKLLKNTAAFKNIKTFNCALGNVTKEIDFSFSDSHFGGSVVKRENNKESNLVKMYSLTDFLNNNNIYNVDILKFDIEGAEEMLLTDLAIKEKVKELVGEIHNDLTTSEMPRIIESLNLNGIEKKILNANRYIIFGKVI